MTKSDKQRIAAKREDAAAKIQEIAPAADMLVGMLDETKLDMLLLALGSGVVVLRGDDDE